LGIEIKSKESKREVEKLKACLNYLNRKLRLEKEQNNYLNERLRSSNFNPNHKALPPILNLKKSAESNSSGNDEDKDEKEVAVFYNIICRFTLTFKVGKFRPLRI
jgi:hypothetical protein